MSKELRIGMIGYGFMGRAHSNAYCKVGNFFDLEVKPVLKAVCARNEENAKAFADNWGYESVETDWRKLIERDDIDAVDVCVPNNLHKEISLAAAAAGKAILARGRDDRWTRVASSRLSRDLRPGAPTIRGRTVGKRPD